MGDLLKNHTFAAHAAASSAAVAAAASATHPLDTLKTLLQVGAGPKQQLGLSQVLERIKLVSGVAGLYSGLGWSIIGKISGLGARFGVYELLTAFYKDGREDNYVYVSEAALAGVAAGAVEAIACTPFELLKLREQVSSASRLKTVGPVKVMQEATPLISKLLPSYTPDVKAWNNTVSLLSTLSPKHPDLIGALKQYPWMLTGSGRPPLASDVKGASNIMSLEGWSALWRGLRPGVARDCVYGGAFFSTWQFIHIAMLNWKALDINPPPRSIDEVGPVSPLASSLAAGFSGAIAAALSHSFDTAKTRSQCIVIPKYIMMERKLLKWTAPGIWIERVTGMSPADRNIMFRGFWLRVARSGIASFVLVGSYYLAVDHLL
uniref:Mitochondrial arginine transporter BAC2 n=1 Tax=Ananas comosus var. bracteatus TaxID=296719 RepID=A0A6V7QNL1_ANACO|nr:unnamed protein product [Ananas comosus var. bracteatus]